MTTEKYLLNSFFGGFVSQTECHADDLAFTRESWMLILGFVHRHAMVSPFLEFPWLRDGIGYDNPNS